MDAYRTTEIFKKEFPNTYLKRGTLLEIFNMWRWVGSAKMDEYLTFLYDVGIITLDEKRRIKKLVEVQS